MLQKYIFFKYQQSNIFYCVSAHMYLGSVFYWSCCASSSLCVVLLLYGFYFQFQARFTICKLRANACFCILLHTLDEKSSKLPLTLNEECCYSAKTIVHSVTLFLKVRLPLLRYFWSVVFKHRSAFNSYLISRVTRWKFAQSGQSKTSC
jgi:hypothetical protein